MTVRLHWEATGPAGAPVLVLLNSLGSTTAMWDPQVNALAEQFQVVRIDHRGHGRSPAAASDDGSGGAPDGAPTSIADLGRDVLAAVEEICAELDVATVHLAGLSIGGMVAMWLAAHHPERIQRLALLCTSAHLPPAQGWLDRAATVREAGIEAIADAVLARWITPELAQRDPDLRERLRRMLLSSDPQSYAQLCEAIAGMDQRADLARISAPTLVIAGAQDAAIPPAHAEVIAAGIAGAQLVVLSPAAHIATVEQSGAITRLLLEHLRGGATLSGGYATRRAVLGDEHVDRSIAATTALTAPFQEFLTRYAWGDVWSRPGLSRRERSIVTLAALVTLGAEHEIPMHVSAAVRNGLRPDEIGEVLLHTALYAGLPRSNRAFALAQEVLAAMGAPPSA